MICFISLSSWTTECYWKALEAMEPFDEVTSLPLLPTCLFPIPVALLSPPRRLATSRSALVVVHLEDTACFEWIQTNHVLRKQKGKRLFSGGGRKEKGFPPRQEVKAKVKEVHQR